MAKKAKLFGNEIDVKNGSYLMPASLESKFQLKTCIEVSATRSNNKAITVTFKEHDLIGLQFTDNTEWIGHPADVQEIYDEKTLTKRSSGDEDYLFEAQISSAENSRGIIKRALVKIFSVFEAKNVAEITMEALGKHYDAKVQPNPGLYLLDANLARKPFKANEASSSYLLLLHGTLSTAVDAFGNLHKANDSWSTLFNKYGDNIAAFEHYTLSESPLLNALDFLKACPDNSTLDILSHSRGGLVADILAKCDSRNHVVGFSSNELSIFKSADTQSHKLMLAINVLANEKRIKVGKVVRVAAPSSGTTILSRRVDHFFNLLLNAVSLAFGVRNPLYQTVKAFLLELISQKEDPDVLPGLNSMMPESLFQKMMNSGDTSVVNELYAISGDAEVGGVNLDALKVILANLFYQDANDLVVDTRRMNHGVKRIDGMYKFLSQGSETNHFNYFSNANTCQAMLQAFQATSESAATVYTKYTYAEGERGVVLDLFSLDGIKYVPKEVTKDVVIIVPGIMGSTLANDDEAQWVDIPEMNKGGIARHLNISADKVEATGIIKKFYGKLGDRLSDKYDVISLEFDWRKSVKEAAKKLKEHLENLINEHDVNIHVVAHSMGGLVVRQCMMSHASTWSAFQQNEANKFVMLGTPWLGSYLIMEVLTGHSKRVKQLATIDFKNNRKDLLKIFWKYPGVLELLPVEEDGNRPFWQADFWEELQSIAKLKHMPAPKSNLKSLKDFNKFRTNVKTFLDALDSDKDFFKNVYYICGKADKTVFDYKFKNRFLSSKKKLVYKATSHGDGSVTWQTGIPKQLRGSRNLYYTNITHGELANEPDIFDGILDLLATGTTNRLSTQQPESRSGEIISEIHEHTEPLYNTDAVIKALFDTEQPSEPEAETINVKVINGDLKVSSYPVMVGHFFMDLILSAEKALDGYLNDRLSQRLAIGRYPGKVGESEVFFNLNTQPKGAIVCGLGNTDTLTPFLLSKTVRLATLKYAMFMRDNYTLPRAKKHATGISFILMGIGYGKLPIEDSLKGILLGVAAANKQIKQVNNGLKVIKDIEIVNYYESVSSQAYFSLSRMRDTDNRININLGKGVIRRSGAKKKQLFADVGYNWWYNLHINSITEKVDDDCYKEKVVGFKYYSSNGLARVEQEMVGIGLHKVEYLLNEQSHSSQWDKRLSKTLFEMLVPNEFKNTFRNQGNMIIKLDKEAAQLPWELLHDKEVDDTPASVTSSFIRQLVTEDSPNFVQVALNNNNAFIVGDPEYGREDLPQLPAAKAEAEWVSGRLNQGGYNPTLLVNDQASNIMMELFNKQYKILHFAGHGLYAPEDGDVGIAIGNGICIDPAMINQIGYVPEFVFINCCYSGAINAEDDRYSKERYRLAANVGTQLIEMGVKAIVISGWAVDDAAAKTFAETFYENMFEGYDFGSSVQKARLTCYQNHSGTNTWGAYQCYGNQFYKFNNRKKSKKTELEYVIASQVHTDMDNLLIAIRDREHDTKTTLQKLDHYLDKAEQSNLLDAVVLEKEALIYDELGKFDIALQKFKELFTYDNGNFSIEALEQYCVIKSHHLHRKTLQSDLMEIEFLTLVGKNPSRLNIVGNAYKMASLEVDGKQKNVYLEKAFKYYEAAHKASTDRYDGNFLDAITNMIFVGHILELLGSDKLADRIIACDAFENVTDVTKYLTELHGELEGFDKSNLDVSVLIGIAETSYGLMLLKNKFKPTIELDIIEKFKHIFQLLYSPRYIYAEMIQIDFLLHYIKDEVIREQLNQIKNEVKKLLR